MLTAKLSGGTTTTPITRTATADAYVKDGSAATTNFGQAADLQLKNSMQTGLRREAALRFDISSLPAIGKATLRLYGRLIDTGSMNIPVAAYKAASGTWTEDGVTWNARPGISGTEVARVTVTDTTARWYDLDITALVKAEKAAGRTSVDLVLRALATSAPYITFASAEAAGANGPKLVITPATVTPPPPTTTTKLSATDDAYVRDGSTYANTNFGAAGELQLKNTTAAGYRRESLLKFDLSGVSLSSTSRVTLRLFGRLSDSSATNVAAAVYKASSSSWIENSVTWNTRPGVSGVAAATFTVNDAAARWYDIDITTLARAEKNAGRNVLALVLRNVGSTNNYTVFNSAEAASNRPELLVTT
jgi:hypothetical protein